MDTKTPNKNTPNFLSVLPMLIIYIFFILPCILWNLSCLLKEWFSSNLLVLLVFIHIIFFIAFIFSFSYNTSSKRKLITFTISILSILMILIVSSFQNYYYSKFTPTKWHNHIEARYHMFDDFIEKNNIIGKQISDIEQLLGKADNERIDYNYIEVYKSSGKCNGFRKNYSMGRSEDLFLHGTFDYFIIHYNKENTVIGYEACHVSY